MVKVHRTLIEAKAEIDQAIKDAEHGTSGELVVVVTRQAGDYGRAEACFAFVVSLAFFVLSWVLGQRILPEEWTSFPTLRLPLWACLLILVGGFVAGLVLARLVPSIGIALTPKRVADAEAEAGAAVAFRRLNVSNTKADTGVLIYVAERERRVIVLGDRAIASQVPDAAWEGIRDAVIDGIRAGDPAKGVLEGIRLAGDLLRTHCPCDPSSDSDELPNQAHLG